MRCCVPLGISMKHGERNLVLKSVARFLYRSFLAVNPLSKSFAPVPAPRPPLTIRVGIAGHLYIDEINGPRDILIEAFGAIRTLAAEFNQPYTRLLPACASFGPPPPLSRNFTLAEFGKWLSRRKPGPTAAVPPECRIIASLASGADQFAAEIAHGAPCNFAIDAIFPFSAQRFRHEIYSNCLSNRMVAPNDRADFARRSIRRFDALAADARVRLECGSAESNEMAYANAAVLVLAHCDILLAIVDSNAQNAVKGGTMWSIERARVEGIPVLRIYSDRCGPPHNPFLPALLRGNTVEELSAGSLEISLRGLLRSVVLGPRRNRQFRDAGLFERRYSSKLDPERNESYWSLHWPAEMVRSPGNVLGLSPVLRSAVVWADRRAAAYSEMSRGSVVIIASLAALAVAGGVVGIVYPPILELGKISELVFVVGALYLIWHSHERYLWRNRWLGYRQIERRLLHTALLSIVGGPPNSLHVSPLLAQPAASQWPEWYVNAVRRYAGVPAIYMDAAWVRSAVIAIRDRLIGGQIRYYRSEIREHAETDEWLEWGSRIFLTLALIFTALYLATFYLMPRVRHTDLMETFHRVSTVLGAFCPAAAAAFAAIRSYGEYRQQAARYTTARTLLQQIRSGFHPGTRDLASIRAAATEAVTVLGDELYQWRDIRSSKRAEL